MKNTLTDVTISSVIELAWADDVSFEKIRLNTGLSESEVIAIMRRHLKTGSYILWRKRVSGRKSKHERTHSYHRGMHYWAHFSPSSQE